MANELTPQRRAEIEREHTGHRSNCYECGGPEQIVLELLEHIDALNELMNDKNSDVPLYGVIHESHTGNKRDNTHVDYGLASMVHTTLDGAENALAYCEALQERRTPGSEGRYFIVRMTEISQSI